nr:CocE/NonD family hydrolase [Streptomyces sp. SID13588]
MGPTAVAPADPPPHAGANQSNSPRAQSSYSTTVIMRDGTQIATNVYQPAGPGPHPLLLMPGAWWAMPQDRLFSRPQELADAGYLVVAYDPRGLRRSGGEIDMTGPADVADASQITTWALAHTHADPQRIGMLASSYGAALSLNAAAHDPRVRVVAALCPWTDLEEVFRPNNTWAGPVATFQEAIGRLNGRMSPATQAAFDQVHSGNGATLDRPWAQERSPASFSALLNANRTAVFMAGEWTDPLVPAGQTGRFFDRLTGPRQLWMNPGGHGDSSAREADLLQPTAQVWKHATNWLDHYLRDSANGADRLGPVLLRPRNNDQLESHPTWASLDQTLTNVPLTPAVPTTGTSTILAATDSPAGSGLFPVAGRLDSVGLPPTTSLPLLVLPLAAVWQGTPLTQPWALRGSPRLHTTVTYTADHGTFVTYLYDVDALGVARLLSHAPYTFRSIPAGTPMPVDLVMPAVGWDVPAGHRLAMVMDGGDHRYSGTSPTGATLAFSAADTHLAVPARRG